MSRSRQALVTHLAAAAALSGALAGCASLDFDQIPGPRQQAQLEIPRTARRVCDVLPAAASSLQLVLRRASSNLPAGRAGEAGGADVLQPANGGCLAELAREAPWWLPGDDGVRLRVRVAPARTGGSPQALVGLEIKRVAAGQVWIEADGQPFLKRLQDLATAQP